MQTIYTQIGSKGQLVIPAELREEVKLSIGTKVRDQGVDPARRQCASAPDHPGFIDNLIGRIPGAGLEREAIHREDEEQ
jgi:hypothetical protein